MTINIGTNFSYRGQNFLGQRQGLAKTTADLLSLSEIVPEGFEVYSSENSKRYTTYRSDFSSIETGHFKLRIDSELEDSDIQKEVDSIGKTLDQIDSKVLPIEFRNVVIISKGKNIYLIGKTIIPEISLELWKDDKKIKADVMINGKEDPNNIYPYNYLFKDICFNYKQNGLLNLEFKQAAPLF